MNHSRALRSLSTGGASGASLESKMDKSKLSPKSHVLGGGAACRALTSSAGPQQSSQPAAPRRPRTLALSADIFLLSVQTLFTRSGALLADRVLISQSAKSSMPLVQSVFKLTRSHHLSSSPVLLCLFRSRIFALSVTSQSSLYSLPDTGFIGSTVFSESLTREILTC